MDDATKLEWPHRMNASDALFWFLDTVPELRSTIGVLLVLERVAPRGASGRSSRVSWAACRGSASGWWRRRSAWRHRSGSRTRFSTSTTTSARWAFPVARRHAEVFEALGAVYATPLDRDRPLWEAYLVEGLLDGRTAIFLKLHHCVMDGVGGSRILLSLLGAREQSAPAPPPAEPRSLAWNARLGRALRDTTADAVGLAAASVQSHDEAALHPLAAYQSLASGLRGAAGFRRELATPRAESPLHAARSLSRRLASFEMSLAAIDAARRPLGATTTTWCSPS